MADESESFPLHECVFRGDVRKLSLLIRLNDIGKKDKHGNTALHLAVMLGKKECVQLLLAHGAPVKVRNLAGWSPLAEAISYGDRQTIYSLVRKLRQQAREQMEERRPNLVKALNQMGDFYMELKWDFQSWLPLVSRILPSDLCKIHKKGSSIRLDTTLVDFNDMRWERGDISFIFNGCEKPNNSLTILDNKGQLYQHVRYEETDVEIEDAVDILMSSDITTAQMSTKSISFSRAQTGWIFREARKEMVGSFPAEFYVINGMLLESRKRREHLTEEDLQKNKALMESLTKGNAQALDTNGETTRRPSLTPPPESRVTWNEYISAEPGEHPTLGREIQYKESTKTFKATLAMSCDFPLTVDMLLNVLEVIAPFKHFSKLRDFIQVKLPPGFPVKLDIPILPTVTAKITFQDFKFKDNISASLFEIPSHYVEDPTRQIFVSSASAHFLSPSSSHSHVFVSKKQDLKHIDSLFSNKNKKSVKKTLTLPFSKNGARAVKGDKTALFQCIDSVEKNSNGMEKSRLKNSLKNVKSLKEAIMKEKAMTVFDDVDPLMYRRRLAIEFPMVLNIGSIYSSNVILYLDP